MAEQDKAFFIALYQQYYPKLQRIANKSLHNIAAAEDMTADTFVILLAQLEQVRQHPNPAAWLHTVLLNQLRNDWKRRQKCRFVPLDSIAEPVCKYDMILFADSLPSGLSVAEREILLMRYQSQLSTGEIAERLHISRTASRARLSRAKRHYARLVFHGTDG